MFAVNFLVVLGIATAEVVSDAVVTTQAHLFPKLAVDDEDNDNVLNKPENPFKGVAGHLKAMLANTDDRFQHFVSTRIDPLLAGQAREEHLKGLMKGEERVLTTQEIRANRRLGLGIGATGLLGVMHLTGQTLLPYVIGIGIYSLWPWYKQAYMALVKEKKFRIVHPVVFYVSWMWLSGHFVIGTLASVFFALFQKIQLITQIGARQNLISIFEQQPRHVWIDSNGVEVEIPFEDIKIGDIVVLDAGQVVPIDGVVIAGSALIDQHRLTGEAQPVEKEAGDLVLASSLMLAGRLRVRVEKSGDDTAAAQVLNILNHTVDDGKEEVANSLEEVEHTLWPMLCGGLVGWMIGGPAAGAAVLGCNYVIGIVPLKMITLLNALNAGSNHSILIKDGRSLSALNQLDVLVFDKTGTLTLDQPKLVRIITTNGRTEQDVLTLAATAEYRQTHPIALSILAAAQERNLDLLLTESAEYEIGYGIKVVINGRKVLVGSQRFMGMEAIALPESLQEEIERCRLEGISLVYIAEEGELIGAIELDACLRPEAKETINWLKSTGLLLYIISGDQEAPTKKLADELGMDGYFANTLPEEKAKIVKKLKTNGQRVGFIGDGINDAIALREADVSVSFRAATNVASDNAQIVLMNDDLTQLRVLFNLADAYGKSLAANYRQAVLMSLVAGTAVVFLPYKFLIVESVFVVDFLIGINIAARTLLKETEDENQAEDSAFRYGFLEEYLPKYQG